MPTHCPIFSPNWREEGEVVCAVGRADLSARAGPIIHFASSRAMIRRDRSRLIAPVRSACHVATDLYK